MISKSCRSLRLPCAAIDRGLRSLQASGAGRLTGTRGARHHSHVRENDTIDERTASTCFNVDVVACARRDQPDELVVASIARTYALLADRARVRILWMFRDGAELCVCDVAHVLQLTVSTTSHHLRRLRTAGVLASRNDGKWVHYSLAATAEGTRVRKALKVATP